MQILTNTNKSKPQICVKFLSRMFFMHLRENILELNDYSRGLYTILLKKCM